MRIKDPPGVRRRNREARLQRLVGLPEPDGERTQGRHGSLQRFRRLGHGDHPVSRNLLSPFIVSHFFQLGAHLGMHVKILKYVD